MLDELRMAVQTRFASVTVAPAHDWHHVEKVVAYAREIAESEKVDPDIAEACALLHDIGRTLNNDDLTHANASQIMAEDFLTLTTFDEATSRQIVYAVAHHSDFKSDDKLTQILMDADKLEGLGARGIVRCFSSHPELPDYLPITERIKRPFASKHHVFCFMLEWYAMLSTPLARKLGEPKYRLMCNFALDWRREEYYYPPK